MNNFRGKTCGECAWALERYTGVVCRHCYVDFIMPTDTPACPAFVPVKEEVEK